jgi:hypothetical protein
MAAPWFARPLTTYIALALNVLAIVVVSLVCDWMEPPVEEAYRDKGATLTYGTENSLLLARFVLGWRWWILAALVAVVVAVRLRPALARIVGPITLGLAVAFAAVAVTAAAFLRYAMEILPSRPGG